MNTISIQKLLLATRRLSVRAALFVICSVYIISVFSATGYAAMSPQQKLMFRSGILYADAQASAFCEQGSTSATSGGTYTNLDYTGKAILNEAQLDAIAENEPVYKEAGTAADIPWQMLAVVHLKESGLRRENPGRNVEGFYDGIYQFRTGPHRGDTTGTKYPPGPVDEAEFLEQTTHAAEFLKEKAMVNYPPNRELTATASVAAVKDTFFGYNGRAADYERQAASLGFNPGTEGYEGSPYVMNKADASRDPAISPTTWGQSILGRLVYPANDGYGAYVVYAALAGISSSGTCASATSGSAREKVLALMHQELELWESGELQPGTDFRKYSRGRNEDWCADFTSWVLNQAGYPLKDGNEGNVPSVIETREIGERGGKFTYHDAVDYVPKAGDIMVQQGNGISHVAFVSSVTSGRAGVLTIEVIGGNQGGSDGYSTSKVTQYSFEGTSNGDTTGYVSY